MLFKRIPEITHIIHIFSIVIICTVCLSAQQGETGVKTMTKEERFARMEHKMIFPLIRGSKMTGVLPVEFITHKTDPDAEIRLVFDFTQVTANNAQATHVNEGLEEVVRILHLHLATGIKKEKIYPVIVFHAGAVQSILNNDFYQRQYNTPNPNADMIQQLSVSGVQLVVCGQSVLLRELTPDDFLPEIQFALSAKTTLSYYQSKGYVLFNIP